MAPDRGPSIDFDDEDENDDLHRHSTSRSITTEPIGQEPSSAFLAQRSQQPQFTLRALVLGLLIGILIAFSNTYFGLQTGWISGMAMPSALIGFAYFKGLRALMCRVGTEGMKRWGWGEEFSEVENVLVQTVAGSVGTMPLGCGFVGVIPALEFLLKPEETPESSSNDPEIISALALAEETGGLRLPLDRLVLWALGLCFFGVMFAVPLRKEVIVREKLKFPSGTATALMIGVLHGGEKTGAEGETEAQWKKDAREGQNDEQDEESQRLMGDTSPAVRQSEERHQRTSADYDGCEEDTDDAVKRDWKGQIRLLTYSFLVSGAYVRTLPIISQESVGVIADFIADPALLLHPANPLDTRSWHLPVFNLAVEPQSQSRLYRPRYHHGPGYHHSHVHRRFAWLGCIVTAGEIQWMGER